MTPPWLDGFQSHLDAAFAGKPRIAALATADPGGAPRVRHVVVRRVEGDGAVLVATDGRSAKVEGLRAQPLASLSVWLEDLRLQYRLDGPVDVLESGSAWLAVWRGLSDPARALFAWPEPGTPRVADPEAFPRTLPVATPPTGRFAVLCLRPVVVERLDLKPHPHERLCWSSGGQAGPWTEALLNP